MKKKGKKDNQIDSKENVIELENDDLFESYLQLLIQEEKKRV